MGNRRRAITYNRSYDIKRRETMSTTYTITVQNKSPNPQGLYFFQKPAIYTGGAEVYANSIGFRNIPGYQGGVIAQVKFVLMEQYYAGAQTQTSPPQVGVAQTSAIAAAEIDITKASGQSDNMTKMSIDNNMLSLSPASYDAGVQKGAFRIVTPAFDPNLEHYNIGLASVTGDGNVVLSNFITAPPSKNVDAQPVVIFYVNTGNYTPGTTINFTSSSVSAAICDATSGQTDFMVTYEANGTWTVAPTAKALSKRLPMVVHGK
jgi:hypothetical protein